MSATFSFTEHIFPISILAALYEVRLTKPFHKNCNICHHNSKAFLHYNIIKYVTFTPSLFKIMLIISMQIMGLNRKLSIMLLKDSCTNLLIYDLLYVHCMRVYSTSTAVCECLCCYEVRISCAYCN